MDTTLSGKGASILVIDDDLQTLDLMTDQLQFAGYEVVCKQSGQACLDMLSEVNGAGPKPIDLILLDIMMPDIDGIDMLKRIRLIEALANVPVIMLTARASIDDKLEAFNAGAHDYITKPFDMRELLTRIRSLLQQQEIRRSLIDANKNLAALHKGSDALLSKWKLSDVLETILEQLSQVVEFESASIMLAGDDRLEIVASKGFRSQSQLFSYDQLGKLQHVQAVLKESIPIIIPDTATDGRWYYQPDSEYIRCWLGVPLVTRNKAIGILNIDKEQPNFYTKQHVDIALSFANQAAIAIENARLFSEFHDANERLESLITSSFDAVVAIDANKRATVFNEQAERLLGYKKEEMLGKKLYGLYYDIDKAREIYDIINLGRANSSFEVTMRHKGGKPIPVLLSARLLKDSQGNIIGQAGFMKNRLLQERFQALIQATKIINSSRDLKVVLESVMASALSAFPNAKRGAIHLYDKTQDRLILKISRHGYSGDAWDALSFEVGEGIAGWVYAHNQPLVVPDAQQDPRYKRVQHPDIPYHRSMICVPLRVREDVIGALTLSNPEVVDIFANEDLELLSTFADQAAIAIENARAFQILERRKVLTEALVKISSKLTETRDLKEQLAAIRQFVTEELVAPMYFVGLYDDLTDMLHFVDATEMGQSVEMPSRSLADPKAWGLAGCVVKTRKHMEFHSNEQKKIGVENLGIHPVEWGTPCETCLIYPLMIAGQVIGVISIQSDKSQAWSDVEVDAFRSLPSLVAVALQNARLFAEIQEGQSLLCAAYGASKEIMSTLDPDQALRSIVEQVLEAMQAQWASVLLVDQAGEPENMVIVGFHKELDINGYTRPTGLSREAMKLGTPIFIEDVNAEQGRVNPALIADGIKAAVCLPLISQGKSIGVMWAHYKEPRRFSDAERDAWHLYASQAAIAIRNAQLFREKQDALLRLQAAYEASKEITSTLDPDEALKAIVRRVRDVVGAWRTTLVLIDEAGRPGHAASAGFEENQELATAVRPNGISIQVTRSGQPQFFPDILSVREIVHPNIIEQGGMAAACLPLEHRGRNIGVLWVHYSKLHAFSESEKEALRLYASQAAIAYANARRMQELEHMRKAAEALAGAASLEEVLSQIVRSARDVLEADSAAIWSYDTVRDRFILEGSVAEGIPTGIWETFRREEPQRGQTAYTVMEKGWIGISDVADAQRYSFLGKSTRELLSQIGVQSFQGMVLCVGSENLGVLYVNYCHPRDFSEEEKGTAQTFANHAALALRSAKLLDQVNKARNAARVTAELTALGDLGDTLEALVIETQDVLGSDAVTLYTYHQDQDRFDFPPAMVGVRYPDKVVELDCVVKDSVPYRIVAMDDLYVSERAMADPLLNGKFTKREGIKSFVGIPLIADDDKVGIMCVNYRHHHNFSLDEITTVRLFANQAAVAIRNAQLYKQVRNRADELQALYEAGRIVTGSLDLGEIFNHLAEQAMNLTERDGERAKLAGIVLVEGKKAKFVSAYPPDDIERIKAMRGGEIDLEKGEDGKIGIIGRTIKTGKPQLVADVTQDPDYLQSYPEMQSELTVPISFGDSVIGVINVEHTSAGAFDENDVLVLESFATLAAAAIHNAQQYQELKRTRGLVGARTAVAWMGMASSAWRHANQGKAITIKEETNAVQSAIPGGDLMESIIKRLAKIERLANEILDEPITAPLGNEEEAESVLLNALLRERLNQLWEDKPYNSVKLETDLTLRESITVRASREWLRRALDIVIDNAVGAMSNSSVKQMQVATRQTDGWIDIEIVDTGRGIPEGVLSKLFTEPIKKPKGSKGQGVGLLMAQTIIQAFDGEIKIKSTGPEGTTMLIHLPLESN